MQSMSSPKVSLQTFTIRRFTKSPNAILSALAKVKALGINAIELAYIRLKKEEMAAVAQASKEHNIDVGSSQITFDFLSKNRDWVLDFHLQQLDCQTTSVSVLPHKAIVGDESALLRFAEQLDQLGQYYRERGLKLCFHHHDFEFRRYGDKTGLAHLMDNTDPNNIGLVIDCYWSQHGGKAPHDLILQLKDRVNVIHLRDYTVQRKFFEMSPNDAALGDGNLDINRIIKSCHEANVSYMAIEQSTKQPYQMIEKSVKHLHQLGFSHLF